MKMKKVLVVIVALILVLAFFGCSKDDGTNLWTKYHSHIETWLLVLGRERMAERDTVF